MKLPGRRIAMLVSLLLGLHPLAHSETVTVSRRLVRFDGKPAAGAKVRVVGDYGTGDGKTDFEVIADADGIFSADVTQKASQWVGHLIIRADGCAITCEVAVTGRRKSDPWMPVRQLGAPFQIEGKTTDAQGRPVADAKVLLVWARPEQWNDTPFNSTKTHLTTTPELIAHSATNGAWSMMGIDFVQNSGLHTATAYFEAVADIPLRASAVKLQLASNPRAVPRKNASLNFTLAPLIRVAGHVVNSATGKPVAGAYLGRNIVFTTLDGSWALSDGAGRFELQIPGPLRVLSFDAGCDGFAEVTLKTATRESPTSDWPDTNDLLIRARPMVAVSGRLLDENGKPPAEPVELHASYEERINAAWEQECRMAPTGSKVGADGSFSANLPAGRITVGLHGPPQQMGSVTVIGMPAKNYHLQQQIDIAPEGMRGLQLRANTTDNPK